MISSFYQCQSNKLAILGIEPKTSRLQSKQVQHFTYQAISPAQV